MNNERTTIFNADAYQEGKEFVKNDRKVDHIITDPPYNISQKNNFSTMKSAHRQGVDFGTWDKDFDLYSWISTYAQILRPGGSFIIFASYRYVSYVIDALEASSGMVVKDVLKWIKSNPMPRNINRRYVQDTEFAVWAVKKGQKWIFNKPDDVPYLRAEFHTPVVAGKERTSHPTQKSERLMEDIIQIHTNEDQTVLDPFMGSGTTGVAANRLHRKFVGVEIDDKYYQIAQERLASRPSPKKTKKIVKNK